MNQFHYQGYAQEIIFAPGAARQIGDIVGRYGWRRLMLCTGDWARREGINTDVATALEERLVARYEEVQAHVPAAQVETATQLAMNTNIDAVIGLGGGSALGLAKAVSQAVAARRRMQAQAQAGVEQQVIAVIAIPTTYAGSEMTAVYGVTQLVDGVQRKVTTSKLDVRPTLVIYDPLLTLSLPKQITAATAINAIAHCVEAVYSTTRNPLATAAAVAGTRRIMEVLPRAVAHPADEQARSDLLIGAYLAGTALGSVKMGLHHGICHVLGGTAGVAHGVANSIMLPHVMRAVLLVTAHEQARLAEAFGIQREGMIDEAAAAEMIHKLCTLIERLGLPQRLRDVGVQEEDLPRLAAEAMRNPTVHNGPKPITDEQEIEHLLRGAW